MILSRFWYFCLIAVATLATASTLLAANLINDQWRQTAVNDLVRDRFEVEATLKLDARARVDALAPLAANGDVRSALRTATARRPGTEIEEALRNTLRTKLTELNRQLAGQAGDLLFAVDGEGWIVAGIAPGSIPDGAGLGEFPLVQRALSGNVSDDVWVYNDEVFRMSARPVLQAGQFVGAIIHGKRFDNDLARLLSTRLDGASVAFFRGETMFAGAMSDGTQNAPRQGDMGNLLPTVLEEHAEPLARGERTDPQPLPTGGLAVFALVVGSAREANVGYAIGRPVRSLQHSWEITTQMSGEHWGELPWMVIIPLALLALLITMLSVWLEHDRPLNRLRAATGGLSGGPEDRLTITDFGGRFRRVTENVNEALDKLLDQAGAAGPKRKQANLDEILGPTAQEQPASGSFFGFAGDAAPVDLPDVPPASPAAPAGGLPPAGAPPPPAPKIPRPPGKAAAPPKPPPPKPAAKAARTARTADAGPDPLPAMRPDPEPAPMPKAAAEPESPAKIEAPPVSGGRKALKRTLLGVPRSAPDDEDDEDEEGATMIARVPRELLERSAETGNDEDSHFRDVFSQFVEMKKKCGEPTTGLTFEKFSVTLRKNREQIVKRHGAAKVRFTVYEKNGKAALKATPIKE